MQWPPEKGMTIGGLLVLVAVSALVIDLFRPAGPPDEFEAIRLAKAHLAAHNEFDYPNGYWVRTQWDKKRLCWRVGFEPVRHGGGHSFLIAVFRDRSCWTEPIDFYFSR
jgi:hypothetical protein